ncbi:MAG: NifU family protein, partial [Deltaproteobacteria bacterium]|nr:NifU family protein [Deltaproteobacteria bacterium]
FLKIQVRGQSASEYLVHFLLEDQKKETESQFDHQTFSILYDTVDGNKIQNSTVQWIESVSGSGFRLDNPNKPENNLDSPLAVRVQEILDTEINPSIAAHGGNIELLDIKDGRAFVKMSGGCQGCSSAKATLKQGVEVRIKELIPEIIELVDTTDHALGDNPYYT